MIMSKETVFSRRKFLKGVSAFALMSALPNLSCGLDEDQRLAPGNLNQIASNLLRSGGLSLEDLAQEYTDSSTEPSEITVDLKNTAPGFHNMFIPHYPIFNSDDTFARLPRILRVNPAGHVKVFYEFPEDTLNDFITGFFSGLKDQPGKKEASGLLFNVRVVKRGKLLVSVNSSNKLWEISPNGSCKVLYEGDKVLGITDLIEGSDGEIYLARGPLLDTNEKLLRKAGIARLNSDVIDTLVELPNDSKVESGFMAGKDGYKIPVYLTMSIADSDSNIFVAHNFDERVYNFKPKIGSVDILTEKLIQPTGLSLYKKQIFTMESPLLDDNNNCVKPPQITEINIADGSTSTFQELDPDDNYGTGFTVGRDKFRIPRGLRLQMKLDSNHNFYIEDSLRNDIRVLETSYK